MKTEGKRVYPKEDGRLLLSEGEYGRDVSGAWLARPPGNHMGDLSGHEVTEHEDGTISVSPSILINDGRSEWHGYLRRGVWETC
jgi:hypothetical protein